MNYREVHGSPLLTMPITPQNLAYLVRYCQTALTQLGIPISGLAIHPTTGKRI
jgi:hypothetical protein